jgi:anionic cell wall polymer biosynthesis LytR-Cps2A-Psr (LCP) family protein
MRRYQKVILGILVVLVVGIIGVTIYGMQVYQETNATFNQISHAVDRKTDKREEAISIEDRDPFSILLMGIDTGALGRTEQGRSDSMMVVTVNPEKNSQRSLALTVIFTHKSLGTIRSIS